MVSGSERGPAATAAENAGGPAVDAELYTLLADGAPWGFLVTSVDGRLLTVSRALGELFGLGAAELADVRGLGRTDVAHRALARLLAARALDPGAYPWPADDRDASFRDEIPLADGRVLERQVWPARDGTGRIAAHIACFRDVSQRRHAEQEMRDRARQQAALAALAELAMNAEDVEPLLHAACATAREGLGVDAAALVEVVGGAVEIRNATGLAPGAVLTGAPDETVRPLLEGFAASVEVQLPGRERVGLLGAYGRAPRVFSGDDLRFLDMAAGIIASALARSRAESDVLERERQMRAVFDSALDAMLIADDDGVIRDANPAATALLGEGRSQVIGRRMAELVPAGPPARPGDLESPGARLAALPRASGRITGETEVALPGHRPRSVEFAAIPRILPGRHLGILRDVTERKQLHARLALADRMVSVGTLAAGVAHELNNPLAYVNANLGYLAERLGRVADVVAGAPADAGDVELARELQDAVKDARDGAERMRVIIRDLKTFSRVDDDKAGPVDLRPVLESCVNMAWNEIRHRARLVKDLGPVPPVRGNEARLGQVFLNLLVNAAQAIFEGQADENEIRIVTRMWEGGRVAVEVRDSGCGIRAENLSRVFDPFFTTKPPGVGTGLGLAICHSIVAGLGGEIELESRVPGGTTFRVILAAAAPAATVGAPAATRVEARARGRILVVDDEPLVGTVLQRVLQSDHDICVVTSARAALARVDAGEPFDLVLSDLLMPDMSGMELHGELSRRDPALARRMIFLTGGAFTPSAREFLERESVICVEKPFELEAIRTLLARRLSETSTALP